MALAEFLMATEDPYGPSTPDVPGSEKYCVAPNITQFTRGALSGNNGCTFVDGTIKTCLRVADARAAGARHRGERECYRKSKVFQTHQDYDLSYHVFSCGCRGRT